MTSLDGRTRPATQPPRPEPEPTVELIDDNGATILVADEAVPLLLAQLVAGDVVVDVSGLEAGAVGVVEAVGDRLVAVGLAG